MHANMPSKSYNHDIIKEGLYPNKKRQYFFYEES